MYFIAELRVFGQNSVCFDIRNSRIFYLRFLRKIQTRNVKKTRKSTEIDLFIDTLVGFNANFNAKQFKSRFG